MIDARRADDPHYDRLNHARIGSRQLGELEKEPLRSRKRRAREARLAAALRDNLRRRKQTTGARAEDAAENAPADAPAAANEGGENADRHD